MQLLVEIPADVRWDAAAIKQFVENAPYLLNGAKIVDISDRSVRIDQRADLPHDSAERLIALVKSIGSNLRDSTDQLLFEHAAKRMEHRCDPMPFLSDHRCVVRTGPGRFVYAGLMQKLMTALDGVLFDYALSTAAEPQSYPTTVSTESLVRSGYLKAFPQHALFAAPAAFSQESLSKIGQCRGVTDLESLWSAKALGAHDQILSPTVCYHCMEALQGTHLSASRAFTALGTCHRFEVISNDRLDRLQTFRMREIIGFGDPTYIAEMLDKALDWTSALLKRWGIAHRATTATDPFFAGAVGNKQYFQSIFALKRELRVHVHCSDQWLSIASFNNHQRSLTSAFEITGGDGLNSGCVGWGYERLIYALLAQFGTDEARWPSQIHEDLNNPSVRQFI